MIFLAIMPSDITAQIPEQGKVATLGFKEQKCNKKKFLGTICFCNDTSTKPSIFKQKYFARCQGFLLLKENALQIA